MLLPCGVEIDRDRQVHVQHRRAGEGGLQRDLLFLRRARGEQVRGVLGLDGAQQPAHDHGIAGDVPARLDAEAIMRAADLFHRFEIGVIERAACDPAPVLHLRLLGTPDRRFVREQAGDTREFQQMRIELVENSRQSPRDQRLQFAQRLPRRTVDPNELETRAQGLFVVHRCLIGLEVGRGVRSTAATYARQSE